MSPEETGTGPFMVSACSSVSVGSLFMSTTETTVSAHCSNGTEVAPIWRQRT